MHSHFAFCGHWSNLKTPNNFSAKHVLRATFFNYLNAITYSTSWAPFMFAYRKRSFMIAYWKQSLPKASIYVCAFINAFSNKRSDLLFEKTNFEHTYSRKTWFIFLSAGTREPFFSLASEHNLFFAFFRVHTYVSEQTKVLSAIALLYNFFASEQITICPSAKPFSPASEQIRSFLTKRSFTKSLIARVQSLNAQVQERSMSTFKNTQQFCVLFPEKGTFTWMIFKTRSFFRKAIKLSFYLDGLNCSLENKTTAVSAIICVFPNAKVFKKNTPFRTQCCCASARSTLFPHAHRK